jgi:hypothetical protein
MGIDILLGQQGSTPQAEVKPPPSVVKGIQFYAGEEFCLLSLIACPAGFAQMPTCELQVFPFPPVHPIP